MLAYPWLRLEPPVATLLRYDVTLPRHLLHHVAAPFFLCPLAVVRPRFLSPCACACLVPRASRSLTVWDLSDLFCHLRPAFRPVSIRHSWVEPSTSRRYALYRYSVYRHVTCVGSFRFAGVAWRDSSRLPVSATPRYRAWRAELGFLRELRTAPAKRFIRSFGEFVDADACTCRACNGFLYIMLRIWLCSPALGRISLAIWPSFRGSSTPCQSSSGMCRCHLTCFFSLLWRLRARPWRGARWGST